MRYTYLLLSLISFSACGPAPTPAPATGHSQQTITFEQFDSATICDRLKAWSPDGTEDIAVTTGDNNALTTGGHPNPVFYFTYYGILENRYDGQPYLTVSGTVEFKSCKIAIANGRVTGVTP